VTDPKAIRLRNLAGTWHDAAAQMDFTATLNPHLHAPVYHLALSWSETEGRTDEEMATAAEMLLKEIGAQEHQSVMATHRKNAIGHIHLILNKTHPITGSTLNLGNDYARLELVCRRIEHAMGWPADRGRFDVAIVNNEVELCPKPAGHWAQKTQERNLGLRPDGAAVRAHHLRTGSGYLLDAMTANISDFAKKVMNWALDWQSVHTGLARAGLEYVPVRSGARIRETTTGRFMAACQMGSKYSFGNMRKKLGAFVGPRVATVDALSVTKVTPMQQVKSLKQAQKTERVAIRFTLQGARHLGAQTLRAIMCDGHKSDVNALKATLGMPRPRPQPTPIAPDTARYRQPVRRKLSGLAPQDDHTARRQDWILSSHTPDPYAPDIIASAIAPYHDTIRVDGSGNLLFAKRSANGGITGFDRLMTRTDPPAQMPKTSDGGICAIGPQHAQSCILVRTPLEAITLLLQVEGDPPLVIVTDDAIDPNLLNQLRERVPGRRFAIASGSEVVQQAWVRKMHSAISSAKALQQKPDAALEQPEDADVRQIGGAGFDDPFSGP
jgi:hypothetical protein